LHSIDLFQKEARLLLVPSVQLIPFNFHYSKYKMRSTLSDNVLVLLCLLSFLGCHQHSIFAFTVTPTTAANRASSASIATTSSSSLGASIGLGPEQLIEEEKGEEKGKQELVAGVDYEVPDHESYRTSRRSNLDEQCDQWFGALLGDEKQHGVLGSLADDTREIFMTPVPLINEVRAVPYWLLILIGFVAGR